MLTLNVAAGTRLPRAVRDAQDRHEKIERVKRGEIPPPYEPSDRDRLIVRAAVMNGLKDEEIAPLINWPTGLSVTALRDHFAAELRDGQNNVLAAVAANMVRLALGSDKAAVTAGIFILTSKGNWKNQHGRAAAPPGPTAPGGDGDDNVYQFTLKIGERTGE